MFKKIGRDYIRIFESLREVKDEITERYNGRKRFMIPVALTYAVVTDDRKIFLGKKGKLLKYVGTFSLPCGSLILPITIAYDTSKMIRSRLKIRNLEDKI